MCREHDKSTLSPPPPPLKDEHLLVSSQKEWQDLMGTEDKREKQDPQGEEEGEEGEEEEEESIMEIFCHKTLERHNGRAKGYLQAFKTVFGRGGGTDGQKASFESHGWFGRSQDGKAREAAQGLVGYGKRREVVAEKPGGEARQRSPAEKPGTVQFCSCSEKQPRTGRKRNHRVLLLFSLKERSLWNRLGRCAGGHTVSFFL